MSIASEITRLQNSKADVKTIVNKDKDLINSGTAFIDDETVDDYDDKIEEMQEAYKKFIPIQTASGTEITLDNSNNDKVLVDIGLDGNTEQYTTTGKNLFDGIIRQGIAAGTGNNQRLFSTNGVKLTTGITYTISTNLDTNVFEYALIGSLTAYPSSDVVTIVNWARTSLTYLATADYYLGITIKRISGTNLVPADVENYHFQVEVGSTATTYEPYTGRNCFT